MQCSSRERVLIALRHDEPDAVPWIEGIVEDGIASKIIGMPVRVRWDIAPSGLPVMSGAELAEEQKKVCKVFGKDNINYNAFAPVYAERMIGPDGRVMIGKGLIATEAGLARLKLPDPRADSLYAPARQFLEHKGPYAACACVRLGIGATLYSMGVEAFTYALADNPDFALEVLQRYIDWNVAVMERLQELGFDVIWAFDDFCADSGPLVSPMAFRQHVLPRLQKAASTIEVPWIAHTDGNFMPLLEDWLTLGMNAIHPIQPDVVDIYQVKERVTGRVALVGNIHMKLLAEGTTEEVRELVRERIQCLAPGGGYLISSSNSITDYLREENVRAMIDAVDTYRCRPYDGSRRLSTQNTTSAGYA
jgi:hypothetical protein